jgi:hypothetical protein
MKEMRGPSSRGASGEIIKQRLAAAGIRAIKPKMES